VIVSPQTAVLRTVVSAMPPDAADEAGRLRRAGELLGLTLDDPTLSALLRYRDGLVRWNQVYNLTAIRDPSEMLAQHLIDCMAVVPRLREHLLPAQALARQPAPSTVRVLDVGSGGGLPGLVIAMLQPAWHVRCVDAVAKKVAFIRQMAAELRLSNVQAIHDRVELLPAASGDPSEQGYDLVTSRAFASLADFTRLTRHLLAPDGVWVAMKGQMPREERAALPLSVDVFHVEPLQLPGLDVQRCLVWMRPASPSE
jgi:16S rRNA (guanine527-N7)-methyltransferase